MSRHDAYTAALLGGSALALICALPALAQTAQTPVGELVVTASRLPAPLSRTPDAYVITEDQIQQRQATFAADVLAEVPGVSISEAGAFGGVSSVSLRGASSDKTLVMIDGAPVNDPSSPAGGFDFSSLDLGDISRIEVLTGPQGSLWGSAAIGGVIAITSREPNGLTASAEGGSLNTYRETASVGRATAAYAYGFSASDFRTDGISKADARDGNTERDGDNSLTLALNGRISLTDRITLDARARYNRADTEYDAGFGGPTGVSDSNDNSAVDTTSGYVRAQVKQLLGFDQELRVDLMNLDRQYHGAFPFGAQGSQETYRWSAQRQTDLYGLAFGVEHQSATENTGSGPVTEAANGAYAIGRWSPDKRLDLTVSVRRDEQDHYQGQTTARAAVSYRLGAGFTLNGSAGQGFKAPSIYQTTYPCFECIKLGPPNLKPERAEGFDGGVAWRSQDGGLQLQATYFNLRVRDEIDYLFPIGYLNVARANSSGVEAAGQAKLPGGFTLRAAYTHDDAVDGTTGAQLLKQPRDTGSASLGWEGRGWTTDLGFRSQSGAPDVDGPIQPFTVGYATAAYAVSSHLSVTGRIENLAGTHYQEAFGYGEPGRMFMIGLRWR